MSFAVPQSVYSRWKRTGEDWHCPNGHCRAFTESELDRTKKAAARAQELLDQERRRCESLREQRDYAERSAAIVKGQSRALKKRIKSGVCPCCKRSFGNLHRHMTTQHPTFAVEVGAA